MLSPIKTNLAEKLKDKAYRARFFRGRAQDELAYQLREARKRRGLTQPQLEKISGMKQSAISRMEQASYSHWNFTTLLTLADALDMRVRVTLEYAEDVMAQYASEGQASTRDQEMNVPVAAPATTSRAGFFAQRSNRTFQTTGQSVVLRPVLQ